MSIDDSIQKAPEDDRANTYYNVAAAYQQLEKFGDSLNYYKKAEDIWRKTLPENSVRFMEIEKHLGNHMDAKDYYKRAFQDAQQSEDSELISIVSTCKTW